MAKATTKKTVVKKAPANKAPKKTTKKATPKGTNKNLTTNEEKVLKALKGGKELNRVQLGKATGISGGWSKLLGAATRDGLGAQGGGLIGRKLVTCVQREEERTLRYKITAAGKKLVA